MFKLLSSDSFRCEGCGTAFAVDRRTGSNMVEVMALTASNSHGDQQLAPRLVPKCPKCGAHP